MRCSWAAIYMTFYMAFGVLFVVNANAGHRQRCPDDPDVDVSTAVLAATAWPLVFAISMAVYGATGFSKMDEMCLSDEKYKTPRSFGL